MSITTFPVGRLPHGPRNLITDVPGVRVGHTTIDQGDCHTGVTVVLPPPANPFTEKLTAACAVFNGANEAAVAAFLRGEIPFGEIARRVEKALDRLAGLPADSIGEIMEADRLARMDNEE